jgi:hypothetical protein
MTTASLWLCNAATTCVAAAHAGTNDIDLVNANSSNVGSINASGYEVMDMQNAHKILLLRRTVRQVFAKHALWLAQHLGASFAQRTRPIELTRRRRC